MSSERPGSRLPRDPAYWETLAARSVEAAFRGARAGSPAPLAPFGSVRDAVPASPWWWGLSDAALTLAASAVVALLGGALLLGEPPQRTATESSMLAAALTPDDPLLRTLLDAQAEPAATALLELMALREEEQ